jgi:cytochrome c556
MKFPLPAAALAGLLAASGAHAQFAKPEDAAKYRQGAMFVMAHHFGRIGAMASGRVPYDAAAATRNAEIVAEMSKLPWQAFGPDTDMVANTRAKEAVWKEQDKFRQGADKLQAETAKLLAAAKTNNLDQLAAAFKSTAGTCKSCHDHFRKE